MQFGYFGKNGPPVYLKTTKICLKMASHYNLRQIRDLYVYELQHLDRQIVRLGGFLKYNQLKATGANTRHFEPLIQRRYIVLNEIRKIESKLSLNVYAVQ